MLDIFKQVYEAGRERIRTPFFGWTAIVFVGANWQVLFYLLYAEKSVQEKITYFDENTGIDSVYILPVTLGVFFALGQPWLTYVGAWVANTKGDY